MHSSSPASRRRGRAAANAFTLVELLVVIAIIGVLVALLLPAIQSARETARRAQCSNHLKQIGLAALNFESTHKGLPSGGWGYQWMGDPDRAGKSQPGGWLFSILPHLEQTGVYVIGKGLPPAQKKIALVKQKTTPIAGYLCPSRRPVRTYYGPQTDINADSAPGDLVCKTDYAANGGNYSPDEATDFDGPGAGTEPPLGFTVGPPLSCLDTYPKCNWDDFTDANVKNYMNGAVVPRFPVELKRITDGTSHTVFAAEKYMHPDYYDDGFNNQTHNSCSDSAAAFQGYDWDVIRWGNSLTNLKKDYTPRPDTWGTNAENCVVRFGGPHNGVFNGVYCDGSVRAISFDVDPLEWELACVRNDDGAISRPTPMEPPTERP
jgi:prepilin-type N-terminal cleavage/methylation domain-containing protein/prepilin-type processing-associated H-X9-DG protein